MKENFCISSKNNSRLTDSGYYFLPVYLQFSKREKRKDLIKTQDKIREQTKMLKALRGISYKEISEYIQIKPKSLYNFLRGDYDLSMEKLQLLKEVIETLW